MLPSDLLMVTVLLSNWSPLTALDLKSFPIIPLNLMEYCDNDF
jgi:hypothetical protein